MKKSNKLILIGFTIGLVLIAAIHITLYAKYKNGDYTIYNTEEEMAPLMQPFPNIIFVSIRNVQDAAVRFGDVTQVEKGQEEIIDYVRNGDTLVITGKDSARQVVDDHTLMLNLPYNATLSIFNSSLSFRPGQRNSENNPVMYLHNSNVLFSGTGIPFQFGHVKFIASDRSGILFNGKANVDQIDAQLTNSSFEYGDGNLGQLTIDADSVSKIALPTKYLIKANIKINGQ